MSTARGPDSQQHRPAVMGRAAEAGIGKSMLWEAAIAVATVRGCEILTVRTSPTEPPLPARRIRLQRRI